jgi:cellulose biosynthesis protein BcsQ
MKIITCWCLKGGVGKSSLARNLASFIAIKEKKKVLVIDKDSQRSTFNNVQDSFFDVVDIIPKSFDGYDYVVCDMPPLNENGENPLSVDQLRLIENTDLIVCPFQPNDDVVKSMMGIYNANTNAIIQPVLNRFRSTSKLHKSAVSKINDCLVLKERNGDYERLKAGQSLFDAKKSDVSNALQEFIILGREIMKRVK